MAKYSVSWWKVSILQPVRQELSMDAKYRENFFMRIRVFVWFLSISSQTAYDLQGRVKISYCILEKLENNLTR